MRADAERNRARILAAARIALDAPGAKVSMAEIARQAGVGMATLYRNFPSRRELLEALYADEVATICHAASSIEADTPGLALRSWLEQAAAFFIAKQEVAAELLRHTDPSTPLFSGSRARVTAAGAPLLQAAQSSREARSDLSIDQVLEMIAAIAHIPGDQSYLAPILQTALDGLDPDLESSPR